MSVDARHEAVRDVPIATVIVRVEHDGRGGWQVALPNRDRITCRTLDQARREAHVFAERTELCELIVHDAYHRVLSRELVNPDLGATAASSERRTFSDPPNAARRAR